MGSNTILIYDAVDESVEQFLNNS